MMSRPLPSAPRKNLPSAFQYCGPIGTPSSPTTFFCSPSTVIVSERWPSVGPVLAMLSAHSGAAAHTATSNDEEGPEQQGDLVALQPPKAETPGAQSMDVFLLSLLFPGRRPLKGRLGCRLSGQVRSSPSKATLPDGEGADAPSPCGSGSTSYLRHQLE